MWARIGFRHSECVDSLVGQGQGQDEGEGGVKDEGRWLGQWMSVGQDLDQGQVHGRRVCRRIGGFVCFGLCFVCGPMGVGCKKLLE